MPDSPLVLGAAGGSFASVAFGLLRQLLTEDPLAVSNVVPGLKDCLCTAIDLEITDWRTAQIFIAGPICGICAGPIIDIIWLLRQRWRRFVWSGFASGAPSPPRALYKVI